MGRPPTGSYRERNGSLLASVPVSQGSTKRLEVSFRIEDRAAAEEWVRTQLARTAAGEDAVRPVKQPHRGVVIKPTAVPDSGSVSFADIAELWVTECYIHQHKAGAERTEDIRRDLRKHLVPAFDTIFFLSPIEARKLVVDWTRAMAGYTAVQPSSPFTPAAKGYARNTVTEWLWIVREILNYGYMVGLSPAVPLDKVTALSPPGKPKKRMAPLLSIADCAGLASKLHVVHQVTLWLLRLAGLRISEAFGLRVGSFIVDDGGDGFLVIEEQAGRTFLHFVDEERSGITKTHRSETVKTDAAYRLIAIPASLTSMLLNLVGVYHTDTDGNVDQQASLIPPLRSKDAGAGAFRTALRKAGRAAPDDSDEPTDLVPHDLRKSLGTDLGWAHELSELLRRRMLGHRAGSDVTNLVYTLDSRLKKDLIPAAHMIQSEVRETGLMSLIVPTVLIPQYGKQLYDEARRCLINARLSVLGWQAHIDEKRMNTAEAASTLNMSETATRRLFPDVIDAVRDDNSAWWPLRDDVVAYRDRWDGFFTLEDVSDNFGVSYHQARDVANRLQLQPVKDERARRMYLDRDQCKEIAAELERLRQLSVRSVPVSEAATILGVRHPAISMLAKKGRIEYDEERNAADHRFVTRASIEAELARSKTHRRTDVSGCFGFQRELRSRSDQLGLPA